MINPQDQHTMPDAHDLSWRDQFDGWLRDERSRIVNKQFNEITRTDLPKDNSEALKVLMLTYPEINTSQYISFAENRLSLRKNDVFIIAIELGHLDVLKWFKENNLLVNLYQGNQRRLYRYYLECASTGGHLKVLQWFLQEFLQEFPERWKKIDDGSGYKILSVASQKGHLHLLKWLKEQNHDQWNSILQSGENRTEDNIFLNACEYGHIDILKWFKEQESSHWRKMIRLSLPKALENACLAGHIDLLNWFQEQERGDFAKVLQEFNKDSCFQKAVEKENIGVLNWFEKQFPGQLLSMIQADDSWAFMEASKKNKRDVLQWVKKQLSEDELHTLIQANIYEAFFTEVTSLDVVKWFKEEATDDQWRHMIQNSENNKELITSFPAKIVPMFHVTH